MANKILVIGSGGQIGTELVYTLREKFGTQQVIASDLSDSPSAMLGDGPYEQLDVMDRERLNAIVEGHGIKQIYLLAALLSATAEKNPMFAWQLNMEGLFNVLDLAKDKIIDKVFWPSSIAVFGPTTPRVNTPQATIMEPSTVYGISKLAGENWCAYYHKKYGVDVRSIRYPGLISYKSMPGGGTTDYAVDIYYKAIEEGKYTCFLSENRRLPMMFMDDAIRATIELMDAPSENLTVRTSYNISGMDFTPKEIAAEIKKTYPQFEIAYQPDFRDQIALSWPESINDNIAKQDWNWQARFDLSSMSEEMFVNLKVKLC